MLTSVISPTLHKENIMSSIYNDAAQAINDSEYTAVLVRANGEYQTVLEHDFPETVETYDKHDGALELTIPHGLKTLHGCSNQHGYGAIMHTSEVFSAGMIARAFNDNPETDLIHFYTTTVQDDDGEIIGWIALYY